MIDNALYIFFWDYCVWPSKISLIWILYFYYLVHRPNIYAPKLSIYMNISKDKKTAIVQKKGLLSFGFNI